MLSSVIACFCLVLAFAATVTVGLTWGKSPRSFKIEGFVLLGFLLVMSALFAWAP